MAILYIYRIVRINIAAYFGVSIAVAPRGGQTLDRRIIPVGLVLFSNHFRPVSRQYRLNDTMPSAPKRTRATSATAASRQGAAPASARRRTGDKAAQAVQAIDKDKSDEESVYGLPKADIEELQEVPSKLKSIEESLQALASLPDVIKNLERNVAGTITRIDTRLGDLEGGIAEVREDIDKAAGYGQNDDDDGNSDEGSGGGAGGGGGGGDSDHQKDLLDALKALSKGGGSNPPPPAGAPAPRASVPLAPGTTAAAVARNPTMWHSFVGTNPLVRDLRVSDLVNEIRRTFRVDHLDTTGMPYTMATIALQSITTALNAAANRPAGAANPAVEDLIIPCRALYFAERTITHTHESAKAWLAAASTRPLEFDEFTAAWDSLPASMKAPRKEGGPGRGGRDGRGGRGGGRGFRVKGGPGFWKRLKEAQRKQQSSDTATGGDSGKTTKATGTKDAGTSGNR